LDWPCNKRVTKLESPHASTGLEGQAHFQESEQTKTPVGNVRKLLMAAAAVDVIVGGDATKPAKEAAGLASVAVVAAAGTEPAEDERERVAAALVAVAG